MRIIKLISNCILILSLIMEFSVASLPCVEAENSTNLNDSILYSTNTSYVRTQKLNSSKDPITKSIKDNLYDTLKSINLHDMYVTIPGSRYPIPASKFFPEAYDQIAAYGIEAVPYILEYVIEYMSIYILTEETYLPYEMDDISFFLASAYELLGVKGDYMTHWINPNEHFTSYDNYELIAQCLLDYINENGLRPIYPFISAEEAAANQEKIITQLDDGFFFFGWGIRSNLQNYQFNASLITVFGKYAVPYILDYILSHEGQPLTSDEEMHLGILLHLSYRMLGVETTADWHMPAEPVASTTDPFPYTHELIEHLGEYGLEEAS